ncbi:EEF1A lysine methyltransferase 1 [Euphorbia peplus]|nr:EEF1A lysine methyltransferase 1 [Euphorbia peplus]
MEQDQAKPPNGNVLNHENNDDDLPMLSSHTLAALREFMEEQNQNVETEEEVKLVSEDWRMSQFWYDPSTAETVAMEVISLLRNTSHPNPRVACIACPTLYVYLKKIEPGVCVKLLEYDKRFGQYGGDFVYYDYNEPEQLPDELKHGFQVVVADPPYLSKECIEKVKHTISFLKSPEQSNVLLLTGEVQKDRAAELLGLHPCGFKPQHKNKLGNEFRLFTDYDPGTRLGGWETEK